MAELFQKRKITHVHKISAWSEQLCESFTLNAIGFWKLRVLGTRSYGPEIAFLGSTQVWCTPEIYQFWVGISMVVLIPLGSQCPRGARNPFISGSFEVRKNTPHCIASATCMCSRSCTEFLLHLIWIELLLVLINKYLLIHNHCHLLVSYHLRSALFKDPCNQMQQEEGDPYLRSELDN